MSSDFRLGKLPGRKLMINQQGVEMSVNVEQPEELSTTRFAFLREQVASLRKLIEHLSARADTHEFRIALDEFRFAADAIDRAVDDLRVRGGSDRDPKKS